jgi:hypothetical protein
LIKSSLERVKRQIARALSLLLAAVPSCVLAQQTFPYSCEWVSEVTPDAVIRFSSTTGTGTYNGSLLYKGKRLMNFQEGQSQGYGSHWWSTGREDDRSERVVVFSGDQVVRGTAGFRDDRRPKGAQRVLLVGMGSALYYGQDHRWRYDHTLLTAGEGFWRASPGCRALF